MNDPQVQEAVKEQLNAENLEQAQSAISEQVNNPEVKAQLDAVADEALALAADPKVVAEATALGE